ncbi:glycosyltransferase [Levilactobacillus brevis]|uniref:glycosyltransferase n=1 Tax=Levilactobacillus brevis TaxID=1580 RepID=UPI003DA18DC2
MVEDANADGYIHFCGYRKDLTSVYKTADVAVLTSAYEGFSMAILEALGHSCPVVSYNINYGPKELIKDKKTGVLVPAGDTWTLQRTLSHLLANRNILRHYSHEAKSAMTPYSQKNVANKWVNFIHQIQG